LQKVGTNGFGGSALEFTPSSNPCYDDNWHSDACKDKITSKYNKTQFIDLYTYGNYATCN